MDIKDQSLIDLVKSKLKIEFSLDAQETDEPAYYGDNCSVRASVKVFFDNELIYEDSDSHTVYR